MEHLEGPSKQYTTGAFPSHSADEKLADNFNEVDEIALRFIMQKEGWIGDVGKPTKRAANLGLVDNTGKDVLWNLVKLLDALNALGNRFTRAAVNQDLPPAPRGEPRWANLGTIGTYFSVSAKAVGEWLDKLDLRGGDGMATNMAIEQGLATVVEMSTGQGKNQTRKINHWNLHGVLLLLKENGHYLNFDYAKTLKGSGRNSDVKVETIDDRAADFANEFSRIFKDKQTRRELEALVNKTPRIIQIKAEELLQRPGFISKGNYKSYLDRA